MLEQVRILQIERFQSWPHGLTETTLLPCPLRHFGNLSANSAREFLHHAMRSVSCARRSQKETSIARPSRRAWPSRAISAAVRICQSPTQMSLLTPESLPMSMEQTPASTRCPRTAAEYQRLPGSFHHMHKMTVRVDGTVSLVEEQKRRKQ